MTEDTGNEEAVLKAAHLSSLYNRELLAAGGRCGCFYCMQTFDASDVTEWVGKNEATALCPYCHIDTVLSSASCSIDLPFLERMNECWFKQTVPLKEFPDKVEVLRKNTHREGE